MALVVPPSVIEILERIEADHQPLADYEVGSQLGRLHQAEGLTEEQRKGAWSEVSAFNFTSMHAEKRSCWGTHFGPVFQQTLQDGTSRESPSVKEIDGEIIDHWMERARNSQHPVLKARYADLVWDLGPLVTKKRAAIEFARLAIDGYLESVNRRLYSQQPIGIGQGSRALELSLMIRDSARIGRARDALFGLYEHLVKNDEGSCLTFLFDEIYGNKKAQPSEEQQNKIIEFLEEDLARCSTKGSAGFSPWNAKEIGERLASHYQRVGDRENVLRVVRCYGQAFESISEGANGSLGMTWLHTTAEDYRRWGMTGDAERLQMAGMEKGNQASGEMKEISVSTSINANELEQYFEAMTEGPLAEVLLRITSRFIPRTNEAREELQEMQRKHPLMAMVGVERLSNGHIAGKAGSVTEDPDGRLYFKLGESISIRGIFLSGSLRRATERHQLTAELLLDELYASPVFEEDKRTLIRYGLEAYFRQDHIASISILVPQIEQGLRVLLQLRGVPVNKPKRDGAMQLKNLNDILREEEIVTALGEDVTNYFIVLLADARGWNLRNELCHGLVNAESFQQVVADRVIHCMLVLSLLRATATEGVDSPD